MFFVESILTNSLRRADRFWLLDGAMGTQLQNKLRQRGQDPFGLQPELLNLTLLPGRNRLTYLYFSGSIFPTSIRTNQK